MARPKTALISRRRSLEVALDIIDTEGLAALSIRRLADELGVNGASLYHHFENKDEIITGAAQLALEDVRVPDVESGSWRDWLPQNARELRRALLAHPEIIQVVIGLRSIGVGPKRIELSAKHLIDEGVPSAAVMPLIESLELVAIGSALHETRTAAAEDASSVTSEEYPVLAKVLRERGLSPHEMFDVIVKSVVNAFETAVQERQSRWLPAGKTENSA
ncbi:MAG: TetR family transcriptional regulator [Actinomycetota bacterium]|nr:TetR family transcriptional regulator [Actinomycetota bacterium]